MSLMKHDERVGAEWVAPNHRNLGGACGFMDTSEINGATGTPGPLRSAAVGSGWVAVERLEMDTQSHMVDHHVPSFSH